MTRLHFDCFSGISGDMILGALVDVGVSLPAVTRGLKGVDVQGYVLRSRKVMRGGIPATKVDVVIRDRFRSPLSLGRIRRIISSSRVPEDVKKQGLDVFDRLARAEGRAHRVSPSDVRFHEVGVVDSIVDVMGGLLACHLLGVERTSASSVNVGAGIINSSHGRLPVPGPAVAALAHNLPVYSEGPHCELTTPTGIAVLSVLAQEYGPLPVMRPTKVGYGAGSGNPEGWPNVLRIFLGEVGASARDEVEVIVQIETNLDDLNPQAYETVMDRLFAAGALDVTLTPVIMKRGRPGIVLTALASPDKADAVSGIMLGETTALGVRIQQVARRILARRFVSLRLRDGSVRMKVATVGRGRTKAAPEYQDCKRIADRTGRPIRDVMEEALRTFHGKARKA